MENIHELIRFFEPKQLFSIEAFFHFLFFYFYSFFVVQYLHQAADIVACSSSEIK